MEFFEVVQKRKAVRSYKHGKRIPDRDIEKILQTISLAPSAKNLQSYKIFTIENKISIEGIFNSCFSQRSDFIKNASLILVFCEDPRVAIETFGERGKMYALQGATIAASYAQLAATALGYQTCWVGNFREDQVKKVINTDLTPTSLLIVGFGNENPERKPRKSLSDLVKKA